MNGLDEHNALVDRGLAADNLCSYQLYSNDRSIRSSASQSCGDIRIKFVTWLEGYRVGDCTGVGTHCGETGVSHSLGDIAIYGIDNFTDAGG